VHRIGGFCIFVIPKEHAMIMPARPGTYTLPPPEMRYEVLPDRMPPIPEEQLTAAQREAKKEIESGARGELRGPYWPILRSPGFLKSVHRVGEYTRYHCALDHRINEMATLMGARAWTQQYAWNAHYGKALKAGLKPEIVEALAEGRRPEGMAKDEETLHDFVTEVLANKCVSDATYDRAVAQFGEEGVIDILGIVGYYSMLAMIMNVARTRLTDGRPLPLAPTPVQMKLLTPGAVSPRDYSMLPSQEREFERFK
jgi:4-carboxymuconolactone decarboxylase